MNDLDGLLGLYTEENITNRPILELGARVWERDRYQAFKSCYQAMRMVDDLVDNERAASGTISDGRKEQIIEQINRWTPGYSACLGAAMEDLENTIRTFHIPLWPWERWARSMVYDLDHNGFANFHSFLRYCEGAAIAPGAIFIHLCGCNVGGGYGSPPYCIRKSARALAIFSYLVHIIRDFRRDQAEGLNYFAESIVSGCGINLAQLRECAMKGRVTANIRSLMAKYRELAVYYQRLARKSLDCVNPALECRYQLSLEIVYGLYSQVLDGIDVAGGFFSEEELNPKSGDIRQTLEETIIRVCRGQAKDRLYSAAARDVQLA